MGDFVAATSRAERVSCEAVLWLIKEKILKVKVTQSEVGFQRATHMILSLVYNVGATALNAKGTLVLSLRPRRSAPP